MIEVCVVVMMCASLGDICQPVYAMQVMSSLESLIGSALGNLVVMMMGESIGYPLGSLIGIFLGEPVGSTLTVSISIFLDLILDNSFPLLGLLLCMAVGNPIGSVTGP